MRRRLLCQSADYTRCYANPAISVDVYHPKGASLQNSFTVVYKSQSGTIVSDSITLTKGSTSTNGIKTTYSASREEVSSKIFKKYNLSKFNGSFKDTKLDNAIQNETSIITSLSSSDSYYRSSGQMTSSTQLFSGSPILINIGVMESKTDEEYSADGLEIDSLYRPFVVFSKSNDLTDALKNPPINGSTTVLAENVSGDQGSVYFYVGSCASGYTISSDVSGCTIGISTSATGETYTKQNDSKYNSSMTPIYVNYPKNSSSNNRTITVTLKDTTSSGTPTYKLTITQKPKSEYFTITGSKTDITGKQITQNVHGVKPNADMTFSYGNHIGRKFYLHTNHSDILSTSKTYTFKVTGVDFLLSPDYMEQDFATIEYGSITISQRNGVKTSEYYHNAFWKHGNTSIQIGDSSGSYSWWQSSGVSDDKYVELPISLDFGSDDVLHIYNKLGNVSNIPSEGLFVKIHFMLSEQNSAYGAYSPNNYFIVNISTDLLQYIGGNH